MDQRIDNTYTALQNSMREMLATSSWGEITILALCKKAQVSRTTFYAHFTSKEDLLDSLLLMFEKAMLSDNNARSLTKTRTFRFLPILTNHIHRNRQLFSKSNNSIEGYPVATRFANMISRLVATEIDEAGEVLDLNGATQHFIAGGIYHALIHWSTCSEDATHLRILNDLDFQTKQILP